MAKKLKDGDRYKHQGKTYTWNENGSNLIPDDDPDSNFMKPIKRVSIKDIMAGTNNLRPVNESADDKNCMVVEKPKINKAPVSEKQYKSYYEKLRDPRWQQMRLQVMERDKFKCTSCGDHTSTLNVHHRVPYRKNTDPWEYELDELTTLCESCHEQLSEMVATCNLIVMGRCWCIDSAGEMVKIMYELDALDPHDLRVAWQILQLGIKGKTFKVAL